MYYISHIGFENGLISYVQEMFLIASCGLRLSIREVFLIKSTEKSFPVCHEYVTSMGQRTCTGIETHDLYLQF